VNKLKIECEQANCRNFHIWNSHCQHATDSAIQLTSSEQQLGYVLHCSFSISMNFNLQKIPFPQSLT